MMSFLIFGNCDSTCIHFSCEIVWQSITCVSFEDNLKNQNLKACTSTQRKESLILISKLHTSSKSIEQLLYLTTVILMLLCVCHTTNNRKKEKLAKNLKNAD